MTAQRRMTAKSLRVVFAIYASGEEAERAHRTVCSAGRGRTCLLLTPNTKPNPRSKLSRYTALQFDGENVVLVESPHSEVQAIVKELRQAGEASVFMLVEEAPETSLTGTPAASPASIEEMARNCSERHNASPLLKKEILSRLGHCESELDTVRGGLSEAARLDHTLTASAEWLLDNAYLTRTSIAEIRRSLPRNHIRSHSGQYGYLFVYELAADLARYSDNVVEEASISQALTEYQRWTTLSIAELWSFPLLLRLSLIESLTVLAQGVDYAQQIREAGYFWANRLGVSSRRDPQQFENVLRLLESEPVAGEPYFATCLVEQLQDEDRALAPAQQWIEARLGMPLAEVVRNEHNREAAERLSIANAFGSLRALARLDFRKIFEATSLMEAELRTDPTHAHSDFVTRDRVEESRRADFEAQRRPGIGSSSPRGRPCPANQSAGSGIGIIFPVGGRRHRTGAGSWRADAFPDSLDLRRPAQSDAHLSRSLVGLTAWFLALSLAFAWDLGVHQPLMLVILGTLALFPLSELRSRSSMRW